MLIAALFRQLSILVSLLCMLHAAACHAQQVMPPESSASAAPIRFLLSFDDGPSAAQENNPTELILNTLEKNSVQNGIKAIFFVQTRASNGGATALGKQLLQREHADGHLLAFHTATNGHSNHRSLDEALFEQSLLLGINDLREITGVAPRIVRPPFWNFDSRTFAAYQKNGMQMLLTHLSANDGAIWLIKFSLTRRSNMHKQLAQLKEKWLAGELPVVDGVTPVVVTFHDVNSYTAAHMQEYLEILLEAAGANGMPTAASAFYDERSALERAALACTVRDPGVKQQLPGFWHWLWQ